MAIAVKELTYIYQPGTALERSGVCGIDLTVKDGEFVGILGASGSGKSTFLQLLNGSLKPTARSSVRVGGVDINAKATSLPDIVSQVALSFQYPEHQLFCDTVEEEIAVGCRNLGFSEQETQAAVEKYSAALGLTGDYLLRSPFELSGGEKRRVALASILAMDTPILLLDEPTVALDQRGRRLVTKLVATLNREQGRTVLWVGHDIREIAALATRLLIFHRGAIVLDGATEEILGKREELKKYGILSADKASLERELRKKFGEKSNTPSGRLISGYLQGEEN
ncbi:MAG: ATP-binding cassette domain-containing protein [Bacillota bacterium]|nr:ATP-binding cassette domain-containing protein [Bacillota bacterium]